VPSREFGYFPGFWERAGHWFRLLVGRHLVFCLLACLFAVPLARAQCTFSSISGSGLAGYTATSSSGGYFSALASGGTGSLSITVFASTYCNWSVQSSASFVTVGSPSSGTASSSQGVPSVPFSVAPNTSTSAQTGLLQFFFNGVNVADVVINQAAAAAPPVPTLTSVSPSSGVFWTSVPVTLTGTNFIAGATVSAGPFITVNSVNVVSSTQITATFVVASNGNPDTFPLTVTTSGGTSKPFVVRGFGSGAHTGVDQSELRCTGYERAGDASRCGLYLRCHRWCWVGNNGEQCERAQPDADRGDVLRRLQRCPRAKQRACSDRGWT